VAAAGSGVPVRPAESQLSDAELLERLSSLESLVAQVMTLARRRAMEGLCGTVVTAGRC
jgi:hypothetical protein